MINHFYNTPPTHTPVNWKKKGRGYELYMNKQGHGSQSVGIAKQLKLPAQEQQTGGGSF